MKRPNLEPEQPAIYQIKIRGQLDESWSAWFDGLAITVEQDGDPIAVTTLTGIVADQAALHGLLLRVRDLGLPLLLVQHLESITCRKE